MRHFSLGHRRSPRSRGCSRRGRAPSACAATAARCSVGARYRDEYVAYGDFYAESGRRAMADLLALDEPPTAVFAASDMMALGAIRGRRRRRERPGRRLRYRLRRHAARGHMNPPLTTIRQDKAGLGAAAGSALGLIDGDADAVTQPRPAGGAGPAVGPPDREHRPRGSRSKPADAVPDGTTKIVFRGGEERIVRSRFALVALAIAAILVGALAFAGCGGDDEDREQRLPGPGRVVGDRRGRR